MKALYFSHKPVISMLDTGIQSTFSPIAQANGFHDQVAGRLRMNGALASWKNDPDTVIRDQMAI
jgi:hypothetical protein